MLAFELTDFYGSLPDWLAAFGTVGAFLATLRLLRKELDARRESEDDKRRAQASLVSAWHEAGHAENRQYPYRLILRNASHEPVYRVGLLIETLTLSETHEAYGLGVPDDFKWGAETSEVVFDATWPSLGPGERELEAPTGWQTAGRITLTFVDAAGRQWTRRPDGKLEGPPSPPRRSVKDRLDAYAKGQMDELDT